ncbi:CD276 antigen-like [Malaclemys terrapin pileata]|uniref:CD276 antigen-like n=1 Tax=Malaclemys terrapin pileata TaxID=2991368 RepID=UPI0023A87F58|nr:CD276 antigen-like [Malaclemys terrapin pileata]
MAALAPLQRDGPGLRPPPAGRVGALWGLITAELPITARFGGDVTLSCLFPSQPGMNLQRLTLTWQKEQVGTEALVVHSYYYGKDQLARQDEAYRNRTWLDPEGLARGNASLTLRGVRMQDEGIYRCHVTSELGITSETRQVTVTQTGRFLAKQTGIAGNAAWLGGSWVPLLGLCLVLIVPVLRGYH